MLVTIESDSLKEMLDRVWLADHYGKKLTEIKNLCADETPSNEAWLRIMEITK